MPKTRSLALITGASTGIGYQLAKIAAERGYDLIIAADEPQIQEAAKNLRAFDVAVKSLEADLATPEGVDRLYKTAVATGRPVDLLMANAGRGLGKGFLDQEVADWRRVIDTNITGTLFLIHKVGRD